MTTKLTARDQILLFALIVVAIILLGGYFFVKPAYENRQAKVAVLNDMAQQMDQATQRAGERSALNARVQQQLQTASKASLALLPSVDQDLLTIWMGDLMKKAGLTQTSISFSNPQAVNITAAASATSATAGSSDSGTNTPSCQLGTYADTYRQAVSTSSSSTTSSTTSSAVSAPASSSGTTSSGASAAPKTDAVLKTDVTMVMTGSYAQALAFLDVIKGTGKTVEVTAISITMSSTQTISVTLSVYGAQKPDDSDQTLAWSLPEPSGKPGLM